MCMKKYVVFGNPIAHSKSPRIHALFAEQTGVEHPYGAMLAPLDGFGSALQQFIAGGGLGANVTLPFKEQAYKAATKLSQAAELAGAVNTLKLLPNGELFGDNTDGIGLLSDLERQQFIRSKDRVLLVGAGGAARGAIMPLLSLGCELVITNRTFDRAAYLAKIFHYLGDIVALPTEQLDNQHFDLIINATAAGINGEHPELPSIIVHNRLRCYDMFYLQGGTPFLAWARQLGVEHYADGLGMLVEQAAHAFLLWHGVMPKVEPILQQLRKEMAA